MIDEKADQWVLSASLKDKVIQIKCDNINIALEYKDIFLNRYFAQCSRLKLINFCCCNKSTLDALILAMIACTEDERFCIEKVEFETTQHLCSGINDLDTSNFEFLSFVNQNLKIIENDCSKFLKNKFKINENNSRLTTIKEITSFNTTSKAIEIVKIRYNNNKSNKLNFIPENFMTFESEIKKNPQTFIGCNVFTKLNSSDILIDGEGDNYNSLAAQDRTIDLDIVPMIFLNLSKDDDNDIDKEECSTIYLNNQEYSAYSNSNKFLTKLQSNEKLQMSTENLKVNYFIEQSNTIWSIYSIEINYIVNLSPMCSLFKCNVDTIYIDCNPESYNISNEILPNIKILILGFQNIHGYNKLINDRMVFDSMLEDLSEDFTDVPAYSLGKFLTYSKMIYSLDIIFISNDANINIEYFCNLIYQFSDRSKQISIRTFKPIKEDNSEESKSSTQSSYNNQKVTQTNTSPPNRLVNKLVSSKTQKYNDNQIETSNSKSKNEDFEQAVRNLKKAKQRVQTDTNIEVIKIWKMNKNSQNQFEETTTHNTSEHESENTSKNEIEHTGEHQQIELLNDDQSQKELANNSSKSDNQSMNSHSNSNQKSTKSNSSSRKSKINTSNNLQDNSSSSGYAISNKISEKSSLKESSNSHDIKKS